MAKYRITDSVSGKTLTISGDSPPTDQEAEQLFTDSGVRAQQQPQKSLAERAMGLLPKKENISNVGGIIGGALGTPLGPVGRMLGGTVGSGLGQQAEELLSGKGLDPLSLSGLRYLTRVPGTKSAEQPIAPVEQAMREGFLTQGAIEGGMKIPGVLKNIFTKGIRGNLADLTTRAAESATGSKTLRELEKEAYEAAVKRFGPGDIANKTRDVIKNLQMHAGEATPEDVIFNPKNTLEARRQINNYFNAQGIGKYFQQTSAEDIAKKEVARTLSDYLHGAAKGTKIPDYLYSLASKVLPPAKLLGGGYLLDQLFGGRFSRSLAKPIIGAVAGQ